MHTSLSYLVLKLFRMTLEMKYSGHIYDFTVTIKMTTFLSFAMANGKSHERLTF